MPPVTLYLNNADYELYLKTPKGRRSDIYAEALKAEAGVLDSIEKARQALLDIEEEEAKLQLKKTAVTKRLELLKDKKQEVEETQEFLQMKQEGGPRWTQYVFGDRFKKAAGRDMTLKDAQDYIDKGLIDFDKWIKGRMSILENTS